MFRKTNSQQTLLEEHKEEEAQLLEDHKTREETRTKANKFFKEKRAHNIEVMKSLLAKFKQYLKEKRDPDYKDDGNSLDGYDQKILGYLPSLINDAEEGLEQKRLGHLEAGEIYYEKECLLATWSLIQHRGDATHVQNLKIAIKRLEDFRLEHPEQVHLHPGRISPHAKYISQVSALAAAPFMLTAPAVYGIYRGIESIPCAGSHCDEAGTIFVTALLGLFILVGLGVAAQYLYKEKVHFDDDAQRHWEESVNSYQTQEKENTIAINLTHDFKFFAKTGNVEAKKHLAIVDEIPGETPTPSAPAYGN